MLSHPHSHWDCASAALRCADARCVGMRPCLRSCVNGLWMGVFRNLG